MKKRDLILLCALPVFAVFSAQPPGPVFETSKDWNGSGLSGHTPGMPSYWSGERGVWAEWRPMLDAPVRARVSFYNVHHKGQNSTNAVFEIRHGNELTRKTFNLPAVKDDWIVLGDFDFQALPHEGVKMIHQASNMCRISAVRFEIFGIGEHFIQAFTMDEVNAGPLAAAMDWKPPVLSFADMPELAEPDPVWRLALRGIVHPDTNGCFRPADVITADEFSGWLAAAEVPSSCIDVADISRREAAAALWSFLETERFSGPPKEAGWTLVFCDEFDGDCLDSRWAIHDNKPEGHIMSSRWKENILVEDGLLRLLTKKEERGGKTWTSGKVWTKDFWPQYGYFEARMRLGTATGLNNAFWLMTFNKSTDPIHFEIDITEARHPNIHTMTAHNWSGEHKASGKKMYTEETLSKAFHVYGLEWSETELVWYFDGKEVRRTPNDFCHAPSPVLLSSAVGAFAGRVTDALDGTSQDIDWVRVYKKAGE